AVSRVDRYEVDPLKIRWSNKCRNCVNADMKFPNSSRSTIENKVFAFFLPKENPGRCVMLIRRALSRASREECDAEQRRFLGCCTRARGNVGSVFTRTALLWGILFASLVLSGATNAQGTRDLKYDLDVPSGRFEVLHKGRRIMLYTFATNQFKPYIKELYTLSGDNILLDAPPDHLHHHGIMYAVTVNGINFWEEAVNPGVQKPFGTPFCEVTQDPTPSISFTHMIHWVHNKDRWLTNTTAAALLVERRTLTVTVNELDQEVAVRWRSDFEVPASVTKVVLSGAAYHGLGVRFLRSWDRVARHQNSGGIPYSAEQKGDVTPASWTATSNTVEGRDLMLVVFARRTNAGTPKFFTMLDPFAYVSATQDLQNVPLEYKAGEKFNVEYLVAVYASHKTREFLNARAER
ncbi:MAG: PmoA family protein, partial [Verrucomicrobiae bacterium]|nr:PmoA family protein [Verrucomicrobiae bacterium]